MAVIFCVLLVISIALNVHFFRTNQSLNILFADSQSQADALATTVSEKDSAISDAKNQISTLQISLTDLQSQIDDLQKRIDNKNVVAGYNVEELEPTIMYVSDKAGAPIRRGASDDYISDKTIEFGEEVIVIGKTSNGWYQLSELKDTSSTPEMVSASLLSTTAPKITKSTKVQTPQSNSTTTSTTNTPAVTSGGILGGGSGFGVNVGSSGGTGDGTGAGDWGEAE